METRLFSETRRVVISPNHPFVIIGERINPTRRKKLLETMAACDFSVALEDAHAQVAPGAQVLDVNAGVPGGRLAETFSRAHERDHGGGGCTTLLR